MHRRASLPLAALLVLPLACVDAPTRSADSKSTQAKPDSSPAKSAAKSDPAQTKQAATGSTELSEEELALLDADPSTLTPEQNRKRAYALRKKIMQDPDSPQAQALEDARAAALGGELTPEQTNPDAKQDQGLVIELPEHLKDPRVSHKPAE